MDLEPEDLEPMRKAHQVSLAKPKDVAGQTPEHAVLNLRPWPDRSTPNDGQLHVSLSYAIRVVLSGSSHRQADASVACKSEYKVERKDINTENRTTNHSNYDPKSGKYR